LASTLLEEKPTPREPPKNG